MTRSVPEWVGATSDTRIPDRVRLRVYLRADGRCLLCGRKIGNGGVNWHCDHISALVLGGENRESNLRPICEWCHYRKTKTDIAEKAVTYRKRKASLGLKRSKNPMPGSRSSRWKKKMDGTVILRSRS